MVSVPGTAIRDDHRPIALAYASTAGQQCVLVLDVWIRVKRNRRNVVNALPGFVIERLDIAKRMGEAQPRYAHFVGGKSIKHEGIIGIGAVGDRDLAKLRVSPFFRWNFGGDFLRRRTQLGHAWTLGSRLIRIAIAAAAITLITSANMNQ